MRNKMKRLISNDIQEYPRFLSGASADEKSRARRLIDKLAMELKPIGLLTFSCVYLEILRLKCSKNFTVTTCKGLGTSRNLCEAVKHVKHVKCKACKARKANTGVREYVLHFSAMLQ